MQTQDLYDTWRQKIQDESHSSGFVKGRIDAIFKVLAARGVDVSVEQAERIRACRDLEQLDAWLERAVSAEHCADVLR